MIEALEARSAYRLASLDAPVGDDGDGGTSRQIADVEPGYQTVEQQSILSELTGRLDPRERQIIHLRFNEELTQAEIAERIGVSQMHVSRLLSVSLRKLRSWAEAS